MLFEEDLKRLNDTKFDNFYNNIIYDSVDINEYSKFLEYSLFLDQINFNNNFFDEMINSYFELINENSLYYTSKIITSLIYYSKKDYEFYKRIKFKCTEFLENINFENKFII